MASDNIVHADFFCGLVALVVVVVLSFLTGGFSFAQPWIIWTCIVLFAVGFIRGKRDQSLWPKVLAINFSWMIGLILLGFSEHWWAIPIMIAATLLPTAAGVYLKRRFAQASSEPHNTNSG